MPAQAEAIARGRLSRQTKVSIVHYAGAVVACAITTAIAASITHSFDLAPANIAMLFLLAVLLTAVKLGRGPAVLAAFLSVALFDFFFVPPKLSFAVDDAQYLVTFAVMLTVALVTGELTAGLARQAQDASFEEARTHALYRMARELSGALTLEQIKEILQRFMRDVLGAEAVIFTPGPDGRLAFPPESAAKGRPPFVLPVVELAFAEGQQIHLDQLGYYPLRASERTLGVMAVSFKAGDLLTLEEHRDILKAVASLVSIVIERLRFVTHRK